jgi:hypothetical protein
MPKIIIQNNNKMQCIYILYYCISMYWTVCCIPVYGSTFFATRINCELRIVESVCILY